MNVKQYEWENWELRNIRHDLLVNWQKKVEWKIKKNKKTLCLLTSLAGWRYNENKKGLAEEEIIKEMA